MTENRWWPHASRENIAGRIDLQQYLRLGPWRWPRDDVRLVDEIIYCSVTAAIPYWPIRLVGGVASGRTTRCLISENASEVLTNAAESHNVSVWTDATLGLCPQLN